jgi:Cu/Ag efflux protein CusF
MKKFIVVFALFSATASWAAASEWVRGDVVKVDPARSRVILKHEVIKSIGMDAMTMTFVAKKDVRLSRFKAGDKVRFTIVNKDDHLMVDRMERAR